MIRNHTLDKSFIETNMDEYLFEAEKLPSYAKTYILPRQMRRTSTGLGEEKEHKYTRRKKSLVSPEFQMSMQRFSLEEKGEVSPVKSSSQASYNEDNSKSIRKAIDPCFRTQGIF